jgi:hypothetical protein
VLARAIRAQAGLSLGLILNGRAHPRQAAARQPANAAALAKAAEELFERVATRSRPSVTACENE